MADLDCTPPGASRRSSERADWRLVEAYHALVYYAPERAEVYGRLGLKGGWMAYFASRSGALGPVPPDVATACSTASRLGWWSGHSPTPHRSGNADALRSRTGPTR